MTGTPDADVVVVGAGIVGLATARALLRSKSRPDVLVLDKEPAPGRHQSGHNSGVVHAGLYYRPDSLKARLVASGRKALESFAGDHGLAYRRCGKVVVATAADEVPRLLELERRARAQGVTAHLVDGPALARIEPHAEGLVALHVPSTAVVDFGAVCGALATEIRAGGATVQCGRPVLAVTPGPAGVRVHTDTGTVTARVLVTCAGLHADQVAAMAGTVPHDLRIVAFRGEYHQLSPGADHLVRNLIYPVPDPRFPFLGVHLTRGIDGRVHAGPNAVLALAREGYRRLDVDPAEVGGLLRFPGTAQMARRYGRTGVAEVVRSLHRRSVVRALRRLVPELELADVEPAPAGVRAQAVTASGDLVDDFVFVEGPRVVSVINAPSPAATASLEIGRVVAERALACIAAS